MSALYHIAQNDPPILQQPDRWSETFQSLISTCLKKEPEDRPTAAELLEVGSHSLVGFYPLLPLLFFFHFLLPPLPLFLPQPCPVSSPRFFSHPSALSFFLSHLPFSPSPHTSSIHLQQQIAILARFFTSWSSAQWRQSICLTTKTIADYRNCSCESQRRWRTIPQQKGTKLSLSHQGVCEGILALGKALIYNDLTFLPSFTCPPLLLPSFPLPHPHLTVIQGLKSVSKPPRLSPPAPLLLHMITSVGIN